MEVMPQYLSQSFCIVLYFINLMIIYKSIFRSLEVKTEAVKLLDVWMQDQMWALIPCRQPLQHQPQTHLELLCHLYPAQPPHLQRLESQIQSKPAQGQCDAIFFIYNEQYLYVSSVQFDIYCSLYCLLRLHLLTLPGFFLCPLPRCPSWEPSYPQIRLLLQLHSQSHLSTQLGL